MSDDDKSKYIQLLTDTTATLPLSNLHDPGHEVNIARFKVCKSH